MYAIFGYKMYILCGHRRVSCDFHVEIEWVQSRYGIIYHVSTTLCITSANLPNLIQLMHHK